MKYLFNYQKDVLDEEINLIIIIEYDVVRYTDFKKMF